MLAAARTYALWGGLSVLGAFLGAAFALVSVEFSLKYFLYGFSDGLVIAALMAGYSIVTRRRFYAFFARLAFLPRILMNSAAYVALFALGRGLARLLQGRGLPTAPDAGFWAALAYALFLALLVNFLLEVIRLLGSRVTWSFVTGAYHPPVEEQRYFLFVDLAKSTALGEKLGNREFLRLLNVFFLDLGAAVLEHGGEIYKYVGDEAIISWKRQGFHTSLAPLRCFELFRQRMKSREADYLKEFGVVPEFRGGLHGGAVMVGEIGDARKEIAFMGDVVNTTARLIEKAKEMKVALVLSGVVREDLIAAVAPLELRPIGEQEIRGREGRLSLYALESDLSMRLSGTSQTSATST
jgi:adenylate cyclase